MDKEKLVMMLLNDDKEKVTGGKDSYYKVGQNYLIRTVTMIFTGKLKEHYDKYDDYIVLKDAAWIAETDRWHDTVKNNTFNEVEPYVNDVVVYKGTIVDVTTLKELPRDQK